MDAPCDGSSCGGVDAQKQESAFKLTLRSPGLTVVAGSFSATTLRWVKSSIAAPPSEVLEWRKPPGRAELEVFRL